MFRHVPPFSILPLLLAISAGAGEIRQYPTPHYLIHTDLPQAEAKEAQLRMTKMAQEYLIRTAGFSGQIKGRLPFYLYANQADYLKAGGIENSGGVFDGEKLMAVTLRRPDGVISLSTWHLVQHEGFHQFAHAVIGGEIPMWANEGLAEYFGEGLFTGDGFVTGLIPQARLARIQRMLREKEFRPLEELLNLTHDQWNAKVEPRNYDQAWSLVHFLAHGEKGRLQKSFTNFMRDIGQGVDGEKAYNINLKPLPKLEQRWQDWWQSQPQRPTARLYAQATLEILTSFLARSHAQGQTFPSFEALAKTPPNDFQQREEDWLPPTLLAMAINESIKLRSNGATFILFKRADTSPTIILTLPDGARMAGRFTISKTGQIESVKIETLANGKPATTRPATRPMGEMLR